ncbi:sarcosine oxidase subunit delta [Nonomuraea sp. NPDC049028]|uniref:sarcosine oxidase subunit delta n=1 Tax=Nonomuraea sp. NPDC049028 TaxID=3364348 RepID=UPI00370FC98A
MLLIDCPHCGPRDENEFRYGGQAGIAYPETPATVTDAEWAEYVFRRDNPKGWFDERWFHVHGCRTWFTLRRHTVTHEFWKAP